MKYQIGTKIRGFKGFKKLGVKYFEGLYKEPKRSNLNKILKFISYFLIMINEELNGDLYSIVTKDDLFSILHYFKKDMSVGPYMWSMESFIDFFDMLVVDLLRVLEKVITS